MSKGGMAGSLMAILSVMSSTVHADTEVIDGLWEFSIRYELIGMPQKLPEYVSKQCITESAPVPSISREGQECAERMQGRFGHTFTWQVDCSTEWEMVQGMGRIHYAGKEASGDVHLQVVNPYNPPQPMVFHLNGKRLGACEYADS